MPRPLNEIIFQLRAQIANPAVFTTLIQTEDLTVLCDAAEECKRTEARVRELRAFIARGERHIDEMNERPDLVEHWAREARALLQQEGEG